MIQIRQERMWTQAEVAHAVEISEVRVRQLERAVATPVYWSTFKKIARGFGISVDQLKRQMEMGDEQQIAEADGRPRVPTFDLSVAAGGWQEVVEVGALHDPGQIDRGLFRIRIRGDSMEPRWPNGSLVEFRCVRGELAVGRDYYVQRDDQATFKRLVKQTEEELVLGAINKARHPRPLMARREELKRVAEAVFLLVVPEG
jgi:transcriptional regulator with XRE-family HTH domain